MDEFKIKFRGVRGSYPVPDKDFLKYGGNTSCVEVRVGGHLIILDAGTGLISLGNELMHKYIESGTTITDRTPVKCTILLSHIHLDHIQGFPFFRPCHLASTRMCLMGGVNYNETLESELAKLLFTKSFPLDSTMDTLICKAVCNCSTVMSSKNTGSSLLSMFVVSNSSSPRSFPFS